MPDIESFVNAVLADPDEEFVITRDGKPAVVLISVERANQLDTYRRKIAGFGREETP